MKLITEIIQYFVFLLNVLFACCGVITTGCGVILVVNESKTPTSRLGTPITAFGIMVFIIAFFASCGVVKKNAKHITGICAYIGFTAYLCESFR